MQNQSEQRWLALWRRLGARGDAQAVLNSLLSRYSETHRAYHTLEHVEYCLNELESVRYLVVNPDAVELALWYHDAVYDTKATDNEERSAFLAVEMVRDVFLPDNFGQLIAGLIIATKHTSVPAHFDAKLLVDVDLSILGQPEDKFSKYERQIRREYDWVPEEMFVVGRSKILKLFLDRPSIYSTQFFRDKYEEQARKNIANSLARFINRP